MRTSSCQIEFGNGGNAIRCGGPLLRNARTVEARFAPAAARSAAANHSAITALNTMWRIPACTCDIARVQREVIGTPPNSHLLAGGPDLEPGTTLGAYDPFKVDAPNLGRRSHRHPRPTSWLREFLLAQTLLEWPSPCAKTSKEQRGMQRHRKSAPLTITGTCVLEKWS